MHTIVITGLVPVIHVFAAREKTGKAWMAGSGPAMTS
jgi:hypothetical protein